MTRLSAYRRHLDRMSEKIAVARRQFEGVGTLEADEQIVMALAKSLVEELACLTETRTGESIFDAIGEPVTEAIAIAFMDARDRRDDRATPDSRAASRADTARSEMA